MIIWIGLAGMLGAVLRYSLGRWISGSLGTAFPWGTWVINISGSLLLGLLYGWHQSASISYGIWVIWGTGFCGAYTTFSTFGYETLGLLGQERYSRAVVYVISSVLLGVAASFAGVWLAA
ncbi:MULTISPECIES: fluoride efflux transporter CrcB [unclassified Paenibacillus]|uniref:fluoride efflux transporter CrcB n=1 Tax=unclassified Paenibacillus TaxID=185978 RepID=UPI00040D11A8|nr:MULTISPECIES: fluoride efflux transporter CrcB [unclassified Paenibacillus]KGP78960.1 chromosome condensation protein CrcB [Paenibacillus sp. MAEPY2]KGP88293.1 chromosome condensation protein CrcB [Paenibacillus sp. MAEPY1]